MKEPTWLTLNIIETIHVDLIKVHGGYHGYRDKAMVEAALARPLQRWNYEKNLDIFSLAASYGYALTKNHGFIDGNKRVTFMAIYIFLGLNGYELDAPEQEIVDIILKLSNDDLDENKLAQWLRRAAIFGFENGGQDANE
ncbi:MAG: type II toxin-antitoxin system death-on-curing family toxin [Bacillota bacterium]|nr:type II toxin-antitoxin system death-on-curing family toxin [Bacillota bacterium]